MGSIVEQFTLAMAHAIKKTFRTEIRPFSSPFPSCFPADQRWDDDDDIISYPAHFLFLVMVLHLGLLLPSHRINFIVW